MNYQSSDLKVSNLKTLHGQVTGMQAHMQRVAEAVEDLRRRQSTTW